MGGGPWLCAWAGQRLCWDRSKCWGLRVLLWGFTPPLSSPPRAQALLQKLRGHLGQEEAKRSSTKAQLDKMTRLLLSAKAGVEHLAAKVQHIKLVSPRRGRPDVAAAPPPHPLPLDAGADGDRGPQLVFPLS